jgi:hypothetical protein
MLKKVVITALTIILLSSAFPPRLGTSHGSPTATVSVSSAFGLTPGTIFTVNITVSNVNNLYAWQFYLYYQNSVLNGTTLPEQGPFLDPTFSHSFFLVTTFTDHYNATYGLMWVSCSLLGNVSKASGSGTLANVTFTTVGGGLSVLHLANVLLISTPGHYINGTYYPTQYINYTTVDGEAYVGTVDVAVTKISTPIDIRQGPTAAINVTAQNRGGIPETFDVTLTYNGTAIGTQTLTNLPSGGSKILTFYWTTLSLPIGEYNLTAKATSVIGQADLSDLTISLLVYVGIRDLAITKVKPSITTAPVGCPINFNVTVQNNGQATETCNVTLSYPNGTTPVVIGADSFPLANGASQTIGFAWNTTGVIVGSYTVSAYVQPLPFEMNTTNNKLTCTIKIVDDPDIVLTNVTYSKTLVGKGLTMPIEVTVENLGPLTETFNVTAYANTTAKATIIIQKLQVTLASGKPTNVTLTWNTTGLAYGNYTISAYAQPLPYQTDTQHDTYKSSIPVLVTIPGDANGDGIVDASDLFILERAWGTSIGQKNYDPRADFNGDGVVDASDFFILEYHWDQSVAL